MFKKLLFLAMAVVLMLSFSVSALAQSNNNLVRTFNPETKARQYQYDAEELAKLNHLVKTLKVSNSSISRADFLKFTSPTLYELTPNKEELENIDWNPNFSAENTDSPSMSRAGRSWGNKLSKYGASLKGYAYTKGGGVVNWHMIDLYIIDTSDDTIVDYSEGDSQNSDNCEVTTITDPPSGVYRAHSEHSWYLISNHKVVSNSSNFSYINPNS